ncbi:MAG TPA: ABC transporter ATP-binding protein [bacterium]|nr:ABC transporter ATP-binding protein [bacterium]HOL48176.1 ABC transporter ATP-binding protein [bacterium]HPQ19390.1 ABC transporter ATP-binding protein [bacterium]
MIIKVNDVSFKYDSDVILENISFEIQDKEIISIIGPNGAGKTTLLKCLYKSLKPKTGSIYLFNKNLNLYKQKEIAKKIGLVPQNSEHNYFFTVEEAVIMGRYPHHKKFSKETKEDFEIAKRNMELTDIYKLKDKYITELSGGEFQRLIIARALTQTPTILLFDEPTLHLDLKHQFELLELLKRLVDENNITILMVLHDINLAVRFSDKILILSNKKIIAYGEPEKILNVEIIRNVFGVEVEINKSKTGILNIFPIKAV